MGLVPLRNLQSSWVQYLCLALICTFMSTNRQSICDSKILILLDLHVVTWILGPDVLASLPWTVCWCLQFWSGNKEQKCLNDWCCFGLWQSNNPLKDDSDDQQAMEIYSMTRILVDPMQWHMYDTTVNKSTNFHTDQLKKIMKFWCMTLIATVYYSPQHCPWMVSIVTLRLRIPVWMSEHLSITLHLTAHHETPQPCPTPPKIVEWLIIGDASLHPFMAVEFVFSAPYAVIDIKVNDTFAIAPEQYVSINITASINTSQLNTTWWKPTIDIQILSQCWGAPLHKPRRQFSVPHSIMWEIL